MSYGIVRGLVAAWALVAASACDPSWELEVTAQVSPEVQAAVSYPAQLLVTMEKLHRQNDVVFQPTDVGPHQLVVACEASAEPTVATWRFTAAGCGVETRVTAWLTTLDLAEGQTCAPARPGAYATGEPASINDPTEPAPGEPVARAIAFSGNDGGECRGGAGKIDLELALP